MPPRCSIEKTNITSSCPRVRRGRRRTAPAASAPGPAPLPRPERCPWPGITTRGRAARWCPGPTRRVDEGFGLVGPQNPPVLPHASPEMRMRSAGSKNTSASCRARRRVRLQSRRGAQRLSGRDRGLVGERLGVLVHVAVPAPWIDQSSIVGTSSRGIVIGTVGAPRPRCRRCGRSGNGVHERGQRLRAQHGGSRRRARVSSAQDGSPVHQHVAGGERSSTWLQLSHPRTATRTLSGSRDKGIGHAIGEGRHLNAAGGRAAQL